MKLEIRPVWVYLAIATLVIVLALGLAGLLIVTVGFLDSTAAGIIAENDRIDCHPQGGIGEASCRQLGCEYVEPSVAGPPACFLTPERHSYVYDGPKSTSSQSGGPWSVVDKNKQAVPVRVKGDYSVSGEPAIPKLTVEFERYSTRVMGFRIKDAEHARYEVPSSVVKLAIPRRLNNHFYRVEYVSDSDAPFAFKVVRRSTNTTLFDTTLGGMVFEDKFLQIVTKLASPYVYGFGENRHDSFRHKLDWSTTPLFSRHADSKVRDDARNYGGVHPFVMVVENDGNAHGIFLLNSHAIDYKLQPSPALTLRAMGGVLEFVICFGVTPNDVIIEYTQTIGRPEIPSYWSLGFHESTLVEDADSVVTKFERAKLPLDVLHVRSRDSDREWDVTVLRESLGKAVKKLHNSGGHAVVSLTPFIRVDAEDENLRSAYQTGLWKDIFVKWPAAYTNSTPSYTDAANIGPSNTLFGYDKSSLLVAYTDFFQPAAVTWWNTWLTELHEQVPWDGLSLEQNQPYSHSTNYDGLQCPKNSSSKYPPVAVRAWSSSQSKNRLSENTICMSAEHKIENVTFRHYDVHNIYGHSQAVATKMSVQKITGKRGLVMSESNFPGTGTVAGVGLKTSLGSSVKQAIRQSISSAFEFNLFGITLAGGYAEAKSEDQANCAKWQIFTIFHVLAKSVLSDCYKEGPIEPAVLDAVKKALDTRFTLLPYLYTLFFHGLMEGEAIFRPLFFEYGTKLHNRNVLDVGEQFFWGSAVMFVPSLGGNATRSVYFPADTFYRFDTGEKVVGNASHTDVAIPVNEMGIFLRAGYIVPAQPPQGATSLRAARTKGYSLLISPHFHTDGTASANGNFFLDDGESLDTLEKRDYMSWFIYNSWQEGNFTRALLDYDVERNLAKDFIHTRNFTSFVVYGFSHPDDLRLRLNGRDLVTGTDVFSSDFNRQTQILTVYLSVPLQHSFKLEIMYAD